MSVSPSTVTHLHLLDDYQQPWPPSIQTQTQTSPSTTPVLTRCPKQFALACHSCRQRKTKCYTDTDSGGACHWCAKLGIACTFPEYDARSRTAPREMIKALKAKVARLEAQVEEYQARERASTVSVDRVGQRVAARLPAFDDTPALADYDTSEAAEDDADADTEADSAPSSSSSTSDAPSGPAGMIARLCAGRSQLNSDRRGRLRFFGPTSSLHVTENVTCSLLNRHFSSVEGRPVRQRWQDDFPVDVEQHLLENYWQYQHAVLPIIHKEVFLRDMKNGDTKYCSVLLVYCLMARGAAVSERAELRALVLAEDVDDEPPPLLEKCAALLQDELDYPGITTAWSLQLLSDMHCAVGNDAKGWMEARGIGSLSIELGLHRDSAEFNLDQAVPLTPLETEVRRMVFWGAFNMDREWSLYLGRPNGIKLDDGNVPHLRVDDATISREARLSAAWTGLLEIVGLICNSLNGVHPSHFRMNALSQRLGAWHAAVGAHFPYDATQGTGVVALYMHYAAAQVLLHRPLAYFGSVVAHHSRASDMARRICVEHACLVAQYLRDYADLHGDVRTMPWVTLHNIAVAATTLTASIAEERRGCCQAEREAQLTHLHVCMRSLSELERSHPVTRRVRRVLWHALRLLKLEHLVRSKAAHPQQPQQQQQQQQQNLPEVSMIGNGVTGGIGSGSGNGIGSMGSRLEPMMPIVAGYQDLQSMSTSLSHISQLSFDQLLPSDWLLSSLPGDAAATFEALGSP